MTLARVPGASVSSRVKWGDTPIPHGRGEDHGAGPRARIHPDGKPGSQPGHSGRPGLRVRSRPGRGCPPAAAPPAPTARTAEGPEPSRPRSSRSRRRDTNRNRKAHVTLEAGMRPPPAALSPETLSPPNSAILRPADKAMPLLGVTARQGRPPLPAPRKGPPGSAGRAGPHL